MFFTMLLLALHCVLTDVPTSTKTTSCHFYSCSFGLRPPVACQGDSEPSLGRDHWWSNRGPIMVQSWSNHAKVTGSLPLVATKKKKKKHIELSWFQPPSPRERPHPRLAEGSKQPMLQLRPPPPREWPCQVGLADANLDLADVKIDPAEVLPRRV